MSTEQRMLGVAFGGSLLRSGWDLDESGASISKRVMRSVYLFSLSQQSLSPWMLASQPNELSYR